jgi:hypothetical protein
MSEIAIRQPQVSRAAGLNDRVERNWIHIGSPQAGPKVAAILSVVESCRRLKLPARDYLAAVLPGLADLPVQRLAELTPAAWVARHSWTQATVV